MNATVEVTPVTAAETAAAGVAYRRLHLPTSVTFTGGDERLTHETALEALLLRAVARAIEKDDRGAGITSPRPGWPSAGDGTETGAPTEPTPGGHAHLTFAMAVADEGGEEAAGDGEADGDQEHGGARDGTGGSAPGESRGDGTKETAEPGVPTDGTRRTWGPAATPGTDTGASTATATAIPARPAPKGPATAPTAEQTPPPAEAPAPTSWAAAEEATAVAQGLEYANALAERESSGRLTSVTVVSDPQDAVVEGPSPVDGRAVMVIGATQLVMLGEATRYARSRSLIHAVQLGDHLFGARSFAVLQGSSGTSESFYLAVATAPTVTDETIGHEVSAWQLAGQRISTFTGFRILPVVTTPDGHRYEVNTLWTKERGWVWGSADEGKRWIQTSRSTQEFWLSAEELKVLTFQGLDRLVVTGLAGNQENLEKAATQLGEMNAKAFALVDEEMREKYLEILVKAWTFEEQRHAIIQIMISLDGLAQLQAVRARLIQAGLYEQLFADMGSDLWDLLTAVGRKFGDQKPLTVREFIGLVAEALNLTMRHDAGLSPNVRQEQTAVPGLKAMIEIEEAIRAVMGFVLGTLESLKIMLTQPEKILSGLWELNKLTVTCHMAFYGDPVSTRHLKVLLEKVGSALRDGLRGAAVFGVGERLLTKIKWAVIIEALTWISEIQAAVEALVKIQKVVAVLRFLKVLKVFEGERIAARFTRLAEALHVGSTVLNGLKDEHAVVDLMLMLPEEEGIRLGAVLQEVDVPKSVHLTELMEHPRLGPVLAELRPKAEVLHVLGAKSGGLTPELAQTFARLTGKEGFTTAEVAKVVEALQEGEGTRFAAMLEQIGFGRIGAQAQVKADLLAMLAGDSRRMEAVHQYGIAVVGQMHARSAGKAEAFDAMLARLEKIRAQHVADGKAVEFSEFVDKLGQGKKGPWRRLDRPVKPPRVTATAAERAPVLDRIAELRKRFPNKAVKDPKAMRNALRQIARVSETDPAKAMEHLEKFEDLLTAEGTVEGHVAEIVAEAEAKAPREAKALHHEPDEVPAQRLSPRDEIKSRLGEAGSPSHELKESMEAIGQHQDYGNPAHHAAAAGDRRGEVPRDILEWAGINPADDPLNGVYLPRTSMDPKIVPQGWTRHEVMHTDNYYKWMTQELITARKEGGADAVIRKMSEIKEKLLHGFHLPPDTGVAHESYAEWFARNRHELDWLTDAEQLELLERVRGAPRGKRTPRVPRKASPREGPTTESAPKPRPPEKARAKPEATPKPESGTETKPRTEPRTEPAAKPKAEPKAETRAQVRVEIEPQAEVKPASKTKSKTKPKDKGRDRTKTKDKDKDKIKDKIKDKTKDRDKAKPKQKSKRKTDAKSEAEAKRRAETAPDTTPDTTPEPEAKPATTTTATEHEPLPEPEVRQRIAIEAEPQPSAAAGPRVSLEPAPTRPAKRGPRLRVDPTPPTRVAPEVAEDVLGEPLYEVEDAPKQERKRKRAHRQGGHGR
ncbi:AHH domain-containing protein [Streptomyces sp. NPDC002057]|uniref:AHH domain-containing protein n=1 Tax=Streptomyces sp. NPDC002057 TaxID=3154664 RepID=UPI00331EC4C4